MSNARSDNRLEQRLGIVPVTLACPRTKREAEAVDGRRRALLSDSPVSSSAGRVEQNDELHDLVVACGEVKVEL